MQGIIIENISNLYKIKIENKIYEATARGKLKRDELTPVVGDIVQIEILDDKKDIAIINKIEKRKSYIKRPKIANLTKLILVISSQEPKPDLLMLDKQLAFAEFLGLKSIIVLNKIDLDKKQESKDIEKIYSNIGYKVIKTDAKKSIGINDLKIELKNENSAFAGNSGVGKSTLINSIFKKEVTLEGEISNKNKKGKNTTTNNCLYEIDLKSYIIDTPGFSTFDISEIKSYELGRYFKEFDKYIVKCEYIGCNHIKEENCEVKKQLNENNIEKIRYENYLKIYNELKDKEKYKW